MHYIIIAFVSHFFLFWDSQWILNSQDERGIFTDFMSNLTFAIKCSNLWNSIVFNVINVVLNRKIVHTFYSSSDQHLDY